MTDDLGRGSYKVDVDASDAERELDKVEADAKAALNRAESTAGASGQRTLSKISSLSGAAVKTVALGAGAAFTAMSALALQGERAMARFQAETGATADEAKAALESMNRLAGQNLQSFDTVADALTQVRTQMGLTGAEAEQMTDSILAFSTATGQDAVQAVMAFDDVSDAWNLTASETQQLMDALIVSHQEYGGTIADSEALLQQLAPTLQAANMSWEDATAILNLFNHAGVDAAAAGTGLNRALQQVKSPAELQTLLKNIASMEDPFQRAQAAAAAFGARAGPKLAQALADSGGDLAQFKVNMDQAAGATQKAADVIENTLPNKVKMAVSSALSSLRSMGTDFGPALTGAASLITLGAGFAKALRLDAAISNAIKGAAGSSIVTGAAETAGKALGGKFGTAVGIGLAAVLTGVLVDAWITAMKEANDKAVNDPNSVTPLTGVQGRMTVSAAAILAARQAAQTLGQAALDAFNAEIESRQSRGQTWQEALVGAQAAADLAMRLQHTWTAVAPAMQKAAFEGGTGAGGHWADGVSQGAYSQLQKGWNWNTLFEHNTSFEKAGASAGQSMAAGLQDQLSHMWSAVPTAPARVLGVDYANEFANGLKAGKAEVASGMAELRDALEHPLRGIKTVAKVEGALASKELAAGLKSQDPYTRATAEATRDGLVAKLRKLQSMGYDIGKEGMRQLGQGVSDGAGGAAQSAGKAADKVGDKLHINATSSGRTIGANWAAAIAAAITASVRAGALNDALVRVNNRMQVASPSPKEGPLHGLEKGGYATGRSYAMAMADGLASVGMNSVLSGLVPGTVGVAGTTTVMHTGTVTVRLTADTIAAARAQGASWADVAAMAGVSIADVTNDLSRMRTLPVGAAG